MNQKLSPISVEKPWGVSELPPPFENFEGDRIGEIWFDPIPGFDRLLVKYIFTSEKLSVQVHPTDAQAQTLVSGERGKEESWLIISAEPGAKLGIGFDESIDPSALRQAAEDGSIERRMTWHDVSAGDFFYIPANTVHAIGAGIGLIEVQQNSDITFRLYDYGRPRELHLDDGVEVADGLPYNMKLHRKLPDNGPVQLVDGPHFRLDLVDGEPTQEQYSSYQASLLVIPLDGSCLSDDCVIAPGECFAATDLKSLQFDGKGRFLVTQPV